ncbi:uncharacterized protein LOC136758640 [Amia ocellicauda]|uniref:uncharacterized protein LOC136758640 n=1 Tax=Amia ocellicauda TaxID=2972642 RepID=UPI003463E111
MGSLSGLVLDETHCLLALCQHPSCWETERRVSNGMPRYGKARTQPTVVPTQEEGLPTLKIVTVPTGGEQGRLQSFSNTNRWGYSPTDLSATPPSSSILSYCQDQSFIMESVETIHFPGLNSPRAPERLRQGDRDPRAGGPPGRNSKDVKLSQAQFSLADCGAVRSSGLGSVVVWVPSLSPHSPSLCRTNSPQISTKELVCSLPPCQTRSTLEPKRKKKPTDPLRSQAAHLRAGGLRAERAGWGAGGARSQVFPCSGQETHPQSGEVNRPQNTDPIREPPQQRQDSTPLRNRPAVFNGVRDRTIGRGPSLGPRGSQYKLDSTPLPQDGERSVDWKSLRGQPYLWRKYAHIAEQGKKTRTTAPEPPPPQHSADFVFYPLSSAAGRTLPCDHSCSLALGPLQHHCSQCEGAQWQSGYSVVGSLEAPPSLDTSPLSRDSQTQLQGSSSSCDWELGCGTNPPFNPLLIPEDTAPQQHRAELGEGGTASAENACSDTRALEQMERGAREERKEREGRNGVRAAVHSAPLPLPPPLPPWDPQATPRHTNTPI